MNDWTEAEVRLLEALARGELGDAGSEYTEEEVLLLVELAEGGGV